MAALLLLPTFLAKQAYEADIEKRIEHLWRVHKNRVDRGLGPTWSSSGHHKSLKQDHNVLIPNVTVASTMLWEGAMPEFTIDNAFQRHHQSIADYPSHLSDVDDYPLTYTDEFERFKKYKPEKKHTVGGTPIIPMQDNDEAFVYYDIQGESLYTNPPDHTYPLVDHGLEEDHIWAFHRTLFNQQRVKNSYATDQFSRQLALSHAPFWGEKLSQPHFFKPEKIEKFNRHWQHKLGLENLKMKHAVLYGANPSEQVKQQMAAEIEKYIGDCYQYEKDLKLRDVYVTDHKKEDTKGITQSEEEDQDFYDYEQAVEAYNADLSEVKTFAGRAAPGRFERGSLLQKITDPFDGAPRDENGSILYKVSEDELLKTGLMEDERVKGLYEKRKGKANDVWDLDEEDEDAFRLALVQELEEQNTPFDIEQFHKTLNKELGVFKDGEKYNVVKDLKEAYADSLRKSSDQAILESIPSHYFWDIKKPLHKAPFVRENRYNPFRGAEYNNFFEMRDAESYFDRLSQKHNVDNSVSLHRRY